MKANSLEAYLTAKLRFGVWSLCFLPYSSPCYLIQSTLPDPVLLKPKVSHTSNLTLSSQPYQIQLKVRFKVRIKKIFKVTFKVRSFALRSGSTPNTYLKPKVRFKYKPQVSFQSGKKQSFKGTSPGCLGTLSMLFIFG